MTLFHDMSLLTYLIKSGVSLIILILFVVEILRVRTYRLSFFFFAFMATWGGIFLASIVTLLCRYYHLTDIAARDAMLNGMLWVAKDQVVIVVGLATLLAIIVRISSSKRTKD